MNAAREREIRQEKMMQMILQSKDRESHTPEATPVKPSSNRSTTPKLCRCGKPAEKLRVKAQGNPRLGREFWKCVQTYSSGSQWQSRRRSSPRPVCKAGVRKAQCGHLGATALEGRRALDEPWRAGVKSAIRPHRMRPMFPSSSCPTELGRLDGMRSSQTVPVGPKGHGRRAQGLRC